MTTRPEWIFFDLDGTLVDSLMIMLEIYKRFLSLFDIKGTQEEFDQLNGVSLPEIVNFLQSKYQLKLSNKTLFDLYFNEIRRAYETDVKPLEGATSLLKNLKKNAHQIMLVTSAYQDAALGFIKNQQWDKYFNQYVFGSEVKKGKPDPEIYTLALKKANIPASSALVVEDSPNGVKAAKLKKMFVAGLSHHYSEEVLLAAGADKVFFHLKDVYFW